MTKLKFLRLSAVKATTGLGKSTLYALQAADQFPKSIQISRHSVAWLESEVLAWMQSRVNESRAQTESKRGGTSKVEPVKADQ